MDDDRRWDGQMDSMGNRQMMVGKSKERQKNGRLMGGKDGNDGWSSSDPKISGPKLATELWERGICTKTQRLLGTVF